MPAALPAHVSEWAYLLAFCAGLYAYWDVISALTWREKVIPAAGLVGVAIACSYAVRSQGLPFGELGMALVAWAAWLVLFTGGRIAAARWRAAARDPLVLEPPFAGRWRVVAGGPNPAKNHHQVASDQRFAYDFVREDEASVLSPILAPVGGVVVGARDGMPDHPPSPKRVVGGDGPPLGNYVAIDAGRGVVFLCHLRRGSVRVNVGERVTAGTVVGACGNSGRTTVPHLHLHAQDRAEEAVFVARGVPVAFRGVGTARVLDHGDRIGTAEATDAAGTIPARPGITSAMDAQR